MGLEKPLRDGLNQWVEQGVLGNPESFGVLQGSENHRAMIVAGSYILRGEDPDWWLKRYERELFLSELGSQYENFHHLALATIFLHARNVKDGDVAQRALSLLGAWWSYVKLWEHRGQYLSPACRIKLDEPFGTPVLMRWLEDGVRVKGHGGLRLRHNYFSGARAWIQSGVRARDLPRAESRHHYPHALIRGEGDSGLVGFVTEGLPGCWDGPAPLVHAPPGERARYVRPPLWKNDSRDEHPNEFLRVPAEGAVEAILPPDHVKLRMRYFYHPLPGDRPAHHVYEWTVQIPQRVARVTYFPRGRPPVTGGMELLENLPREGHAPSEPEGLWIAWHEVSAPGPDEEPTRDYAAFYLTTDGRNRVGDARATLRALHRGNRIEARRSWFRVRYETAFQASDRAEADHRSSGWFRDTTQKHGRRGLERRQPPDARS